MRSPLPSSYQESGERSIGLEMGCQLESWPWCILGAWPWASSKRHNHTCFLVLGEQKKQHFSAMAGVLARQVVFWARLPCGACNRAVCASWREQSGLVRAPSCGVFGQAGSCLLGAVESSQEEAGCEQFLACSQSQQAAFLVPRIVEKVLVWIASGLGCLLLIDSTELWEQNSPAGPTGNPCTRHQLFF